MPNEEFAGMFDRGPGEPKYSTSVYHTILIHVIFHSFFLLTLNKWNSIWGIFPHNVDMKMFKLEDWYGFMKKEQKISLKFNFHTDQIQYGSTDS
jgi:hypothetical protein